MKYIATIIALVSALVMPSMAFAAMPHFAGTGYKQGADCVVPPDHGIWEIVGGTDLVLTGCTPDVDYQRAKNSAMSLQKTGIKFGLDAALTLKDGSTVVCPFFFIKSAGCVIDASLVK